MAMSLNRVQLIGNLTRDPELKQIPGGQTVATFTVATNLSWTDQSGQKQDKPEYHNVVAWRRLADICGQYLRKGSKIFIEGRMQTRDWEGEDGNKRFKTEVVAENMIMLDRKGEFSGPVGQDFGGGISNNESAGNDADVKVPVGSSNEEDVTIDDLPF